MAIDKELSARLSKAEFHAAQVERKARQMHSALKDVLRSGDEKVVAAARNRFGRLNNEINEHLTTLKMMSGEIP
jgi:hypothetical protein